MSFEVFMHVSGDGIEESEFQSAFSGKLLPMPDEDDMWRLGECTVSCGRNDAGRVVNINVHRPTGDAELWEGLFKILSAGNAVFFFPMDPLIPIVCDPTAVTLMPADMREAFGAPHVVASVQELIDSLDIEEQ